MIDQFYQNPPDYQRMMQKIYEIKGEGLGRVKAFTIGRSILGRGIFALTLGEIRGSTLFVGGLHGQDWITTLLILRFFEDLLIALREGSELGGIDVSRAMQGRSITVVPCLNPDGVEIAIRGGQGALHLGAEAQRISLGDYSGWQANGRGVDIEHNFDAGWQMLRRLEAEAGIKGPMPACFGGHSPMSEPETRAAANLCKTFEISKLFTFHSQGEEIYYNFGENTPMRSRLMVEVLAGACGYTVKESKGMAAYGSMKDWFIDKLGRPGFAVHAGRGNVPLPIEELVPIYARLVEMLLLAVFI